MIRRIAAPLDAVIARAPQPITTGLTDMEPGTVEGNSITWSSDPENITEVRWNARLRSDGTSTVAELDVSVRLHFPYFSWIVQPALRRALVRRLDHVADVIEARSLDKPDPKTPARPAWLPRDRMTRHQGRSIATVCAVLAIATYGGSLFTQTADFVAKTFGAGDAALGGVFALTRIGTLIGVVGSTLADRRGRRAILLASTVGLCAGSVATAVTTNLFVFGLMQLVTRGFVNLAVVVGYIVLTEEAPEGSRAFMLAIGAVLGAIGFAIGAALLPVAEIAPQMWRVMYALSAVGFLLVPGISKRLPETRRFADIAPRAARASMREIVDRTYGGRFTVVASINFLLAMLAAPASQFENRYLSEGHGYSAFGILGIRFFTQGAPALIAVFAGGRMAESRGRKPVAANATLVMAITTAAFFLVSGPFLWLTLLFSSFAGAFAGPSVAAFNTELFPT